MLPSPLTVLRHAVLTVLSQLPTVTGYDPDGANTVVETVDLVTNAGQFN